MSNRCLIDFKAGRTVKDHLLYDDAVIEETEKHYPGKMECSVLYAVRNLCHRYNVGSLGIKTLQLSPMEFMSYWVNLPAKMKFCLDREVNAPHLFDNLGNGRVTTYHPDLERGEVFVLLPDGFPTENIPEDATTVLY